MAPASIPRSRLVAAICVLTALYWLALFVATHVPTPRRPETTPRRNLDKAAHVVAFAGLAVLLSATGAVLGQPAWRSNLLVLATIATYGVIDELTQALVPSRSVDWRDWVADMVGGLCGVIAFGLLSTTLLAIKGRRALIESG
jgi:VanZ family protein